MKSLKWAAGITGSISLIILLLTFAIQIPTFCIWFYEYEFQKNDTYNQVKMEKQDLMQVTKHMLEYMHGREEILNIETIVNGQSRLFFSDIEIFHMNDVKNLFILLFTVQKIAGILFILSTITISILILFIPKLLKFNLMFYLKCLKNAAVCVIALAAILICIIAIDFDNAFIIFHEIFFNNDKWVLDTDVDLLINIVPTPFFIDIAAFVGILFSIFLVLVIGISSVLIRVYKNKR